jgi:hypothetical protein
MNPRSWFGIISVLAGLFCLGLVVVGAQQSPPAAGQAVGQQAPQAPAGPLAPAKYKDIQVMKDAPASESAAGMQRPLWR